MSEYIAREAAKSKSFRYRLSNGEMSPPVIFASSLDAIPAADVAPVRHGRWIPDKEDVEWGNSLIRYRCSECRERPHFDKEKHRFILSLYCPNCGARMDGDGE